MTLKREIRDTIIQFAALIMKHTYHILTDNNLRYIADLNRCGSIFNRGRKLDKRLRFGNFLLDLYTQNEEYFLNYINSLLEFLREGNQYELNTMLSDEKLLACVHQLGFDIEKDKIIKTSFFIDDRVREIQDELDRMLANLNETYPKIRKSGKQTIYFGGYDKNRQAVTTMRELFSNVLRDLWPKGKNGFNNRRERIKAIMEMPESKNGKERKFIENFSTAMNSLYDAMSAGLHKKFNDIENYHLALIYITSMENMLYMLLKTHEKKKRLVFQYNYE